MKKSLKVSQRALNNQFAVRGNANCTCANCTCVTCDCESTTSGNCTCGAACNNNSHKG